MLNKLVVILAIGLALLAVIVVGNDGPTLHADRAMEPARVASAESSGHSVAQEGNLRQPASEPNGALGWFICRIVDQKSQEPIPGAHVFSLSPGAREATSSDALATADRLGNVRIPVDAEILSKSLSIVASGYIPRVVPCMDIQDVGHVALSRGSSYTLRFRDLDDAPLAGIRVRMSKAPMAYQFGTQTPDSDVVPAGASDSSVFYAFSDASGEATLTGLPPGQYWCSIESEQYLPIDQPGMRQGVTVGASAEQQDVRMAYLGVAAARWGAPVVSYRELPMAGKVVSQHLMPGNATMLLVRRAIASQVTEQMDHTWLVPLERSPGETSYQLAFDVQFADCEPETVKVALSAPDALRVHDISPSKPSAVPLHARVRVEATDLSGARIPVPDGIRFGVRLFKVGGTLHDSRLVLHGDPLFVQPGTYKAELTDVLLPPWRSAATELYAGDETVFAVALDCKVAALDVQFSSSLEHTPVGCRLELQTASGRTFHAIVASERAYAVPAEESMTVVVLRGTAEVSRQEVTLEPGEIYPLSIRLN